MSWAWPAHKPVAGLLLDNEEWNDNVTRFVQETDGGLNEHNFVSGTVASLLALDKTEDDLALRFWHQRLSGSSQEFKYITGWTPIGSVSRTFDSDGGQVLVIWSANIHIDPYLDDKVAGAHFALELDGVVQPSSLAGSGDMGNEFVGDGDASVLAAFRWKAGPGRRGYFPMTIQGIFDIPPGRHTVRPVARFIHSSTVTSGYNGTTFNGELIVLHLWS